MLCIQSSSKGVTNLLTTKNELGWAAPLHGSSTLELFHNLNMELEESITSDHADALTVHVQKIRNLVIIKLNSFDFLVLFCLFFYLTQHQICVSILSFKPRLLLKIVSINFR